jgi:hypothetical protein
MTQALLPVKKFVPGPFSFKGGVRQLSAAGAMTMAGSV